MTELTDEQLDAIEQAMVDEGHLQVEAATLRIRLTKPAIHPDIWVKYGHEARLMRDWRGDGMIDVYEVLIPTDTVIEWAREQYALDIINKRTCHESADAWEAKIANYIRTGGKG